MTVRIGFIGTGGIAVAHLHRLLQVEKAEVVALCDLAPGRSEQAEKDVNAVVRERDPRARTLAAAHYTDYTEMLRLEKLDAVFVCLPPFAHGEPERAVIEAGAHLFVEKPVALDLGTAMDILRRLDEQNLLSAVGYQLRYLRSMDRAKELLAGTTVGMAVVMRFGGTPGVPWYRIQSKSGGQLVEMATHHVDQLRYLLGEVRTVYAAAATRIHHLRQPDYDVFDVNCMTLTFASGVVANFANNMISSHGVPQSARGVHIFCDGMTLSHQLGGPLQVLTKDGLEEVNDGVDPMLEQDRAFVQAVAEGRRELIRADYREGIRTLAVTLAGDLSARTGQPVEVEGLLRQAGWEG